MLNEVKCLRPRPNPNIWGQGRGWGHNLEVEAEAKSWAEPKVKFKEIEQNIRFRSENVWCKTLRSVI